MRKLGNKNLKIAAATMMTIFSLFTCFSAAAAWFVGVRSRNSDINNFNVTVTSGNVSTIKVYDFYGSTEDGTILGFNPTSSHTVTISDEVPSGALEFEMGEYSLDDPHHPVLFLFELSSGMQDIIFHTTSTYLTTGDLTSDENPLSSIVMTHWFLFTDNPTDNAGTNRTTTGNLVVDGSVVSKTYVPITEANASSTATSNMDSFVSFDEHNDFSFKNDLIAFSGNTSGYQCVGIVLDYYSASLEYIYSYFLGSTYLNSGLGFICDWSMEV